MSQRCSQCGTALIAALTLGLLCALGVFAFAPAMALAKTPQSMTYTPTEDHATLYEYDDSYTVGVNDPNTDEYLYDMEVYAYSPEAGDRLEVVWDDGSTSSYEYRRTDTGTEAEYVWAALSGATELLADDCVLETHPVEQTAADPWMPGDTGRTILVSYYDAQLQELCSTSFSVAIAKNPITAVEYHTDGITYREVVDGVDLAGSDGTWTYYPFTPREGDTLTVHVGAQTTTYVCSATGPSFNQTFVNPLDEEDAQYGQSFVEKSDQSEGTAWGVGKHRYALSFKGIDFFVDIEVAPYAGPWDRLYGNSALDTMGSIVGRMPVGEFSTVILACASGYKDALTAAGLAGLNYAPVLLVNKTEVPKQTEVLLKAINPEDVIVVGGPAVVSDAVLMRVARICQIDTDSVWRVYGKNSIMTSVAVFEEGIDMWGETCIVARYDNFADALAIAPYSYAACAPIFLTNTKSISQDVLNAIKRGGFTQVIIAGGTAAVSKNVESAISKLGVEVLRLAGANGVDTSGVIANWCLSQAGMEVRNMGVATATGYKDALTGASLCGLNNSVLILTRPGKDMYTAVDRVLTVSRATHVERGYVFGGPKAVSESVRSTCRTLTGDL